jgi:hypothetical protein
MKCREFEKHVYLFHELSEASQTQLRHHMQGCVNCRVLFSEVEESIAQFVKGLPAPMYEEPELTRRIMQSIEARKKPAWSELFESFSISYLRPALTAAVILLCGFFVMEATRIPPQTIAPVASTGTVKLDRQMTASLATHWRQEKSATGTATLKCIHECQKINGNICFECISNK